MLRSLDLLAILVVHLSYLAPERLLAFLAQPGIEIGLHLIFTHAVLHGRPDIGAKDRAMDVCRQACQHILMVPGGLHQSGAFRADRDGVDQHQAPIVETIDKVSAQRCRAAKIMGHHIGRLDIPILNKRGEHAVERAVQDVGIQLVGLPEAEKIIVEDAPVPREPGRDPTPLAGGKG